MQLEPIRLIRCTFFWVSYHTKNQAFSIILGPKFPWRSRQIRCYPAGSSHRIFIVGAIQGPRYRKFAHKHIFIRILRRSSENPFFGFLENGVFMHKNDPKPPKKCILRASLELYITFIQYVMSWSLNFTYFVPQGAKPVYYRSKVDFCMTYDGTRLITVVFN